MTHTINVYIAAVYLAINYVTKLFGILQRVIKSQKVYINDLDIAKLNTYSVRKVCG